MQFVHNGYSFGYAPNASQQQALQQQQSAHPSQAPSTTTAQVDQQQQQQQPPQTQPLSLPPGMPAFGQPVMPAPPVELNAQGKVKRKQVKNACVNCQKACKKCDDGRPCQRCIKYGLTDTCVNSVRKERKKGIKRGPYKKRKQDGVADGTPAPTSGSTAGTAATASSLPSALYGTSAQATAGTRTNGVLAYQPFHSGTYDPFHAAAVSYQNSGPMMPYAHMVPAIQGMYPGNAPMLSYQAAMHMLSPQHGQAAQNLYGGYRLPEQQDQQQHDRSHEGSPAASNGVNEPATKTEGNTADSDDEGSKLNILSQLCSAVLDRTDAPAAIKQEPNQQQQSQQSSQQQQQQPEQQQQVEQQPQSSQPSAAATPVASNEAEQTSNAPSNEQSPAVKEEQA
ncbi:hypothetical protein VTP01DRAFT_2629 [Rhizomucor pusillus]|uniref:uncharacterized protein n=1 Tax=Rhizomucor pusillus TaxID=4840 RepID=UPI003742BC00